MTTDESVLKEAFAEEDGETTAALFAGELEGHGSAKDAATDLVIRLAVTTNDQEQLDRLIRTSKLFTPEWDKAWGAGTYGEKCISDALCGATSDAAGEMMQEEIDAILEQADKEASRVNLYRDWLDDMPADKALAKMLAHEKAVGPVAPNDEPTPITAAEILANPIEEIPYVVKRIVPAKNTCGIVGHGSVGKSRLLLELARCIVSEDRFLEEFPVHIPGPVCLLDRESGPDRLAIRYRQHGITDDMPIHALTRKELRGLYLNVPDFSSRLARIIDQMKPRPVVLAMDSWARFLRGEENSVAETAAAFEVLEDFCEEQEIGIIILHHTRKPGMNDHSEARDKVRGTGDWINSVSACYLLEKANSVGDLRLVEAKTRDYAPMPAPIGLKLESDIFRPGQLNYTRVDIPVRSTSASQRTTGMKAVLDIVDKFPSTGITLAGILRHNDRPCLPSGDKVSTRTLQDYLGELEDMLDIKSEGKRKARTYFPNRKVDSSSDSPSDLGLNPDEEKT